MSGQTSPAPSATYEEVLAFLQEASWRGAIDLRGLNMDETRKLAKIVHYCATRVRQIQPKPHALDGVLICGDEHDGYYCDLARNHVDDHEAHDRYGTDLLATWQAAAGGTS